MEWINYHHLLYFWVTAKEGSITAASRRLNLAQPTVSGQIQSLEKAIGRPLFLRKGRQLVLTDTGRVAYEHAEKIFAAGRELQDALGAPSGIERLALGAPPEVPAAAAAAVLAALSDVPNVELRSGDQAELVRELELFDMDAVLTLDEPKESPAATVHNLGHLAWKVFGGEHANTNLPLAIPTGVGEGLLDALKQVGCSRTMEVTDAGVRLALASSGRALAALPHVETSPPAGVRVVHELDGVTAPIWLVCARGRFDLPEGQDLLRRIGEALGAKPTNRIARSNGRVEANA